MKKILLSIALLVFVSTLALADVLIPEFAFTGKDISAFKVAPSYMDVSLNFNVVSGLDTFIKQESFQLADTQEKGYTSSEPGGIYSGRVGTKLSSVFVGEKAFRNNIVKNYLRKEYVQVIDSYLKYRDRLAGTAYEQECRLIYGLALVETGNLTSGTDVLRQVVRSGGAAGEIASDSLYAYYLRTKNYTAAVTAGREQHIFTEYSLYVYLFSLMQKQSFAEIDEAVSTNLDIVEEHPYLYDFLIVADYHLGRSAEVAKLADKASANTAPIVADTLISLGERSRAEALINQMEASEAKTVLLAKLAIEGGNFPEASRYLQAVRSDVNRLSIYLFYIERFFPEIDPDFGTNIKFDTRANTDYVNFYNGLKAMSDKNYPVAIRNLDGIIFNQSLMHSAYFYRGLAYFGSDESKTQFLLLKYIDNGDDPEKVRIARFVLGQIYYLKGRTEDALMLVEDCYTDDCRLLKAEISIGKQEYAQAEEYLGTIQGEKATKLRAAILYNHKNYEGALEELKKVPPKESETDYLLMLSYLKLDKYDDAEAIYAKHSTDTKFFDALTESLFLAGDYDRVLKLLDGVGADSKNQLLRAKVYSSQKQYKKSEPIYRSLIESKYALFDSVYGLLSDYAARNMKSEFLKAGEMSLTGLGAFERKDFLLIQAARLAIDLKEINLATKMVNRFFSEFPNSEYVREGYLLRGRLFKATGRLEQCIADADRLLTTPGYSEDALFLKADCTEAKDSASAVKIYAELADKSDRFKELANSKIADVSKNPAEVLKASLYFKDNNKDLYHKGMDRYFSLVGSAELPKYEEVIQEMIDSKNPAIAPAAYFNQGRMFEEKKELDKAATSYMKGYYLFPDSKYATQGLRKTIAVYKTQGKEREAKLLEDKLKK
jgi:hypothetical protein